MKINLLPSKTIFLFNVLCKNRNCAKWRRFQSLEFSRCVFFFSLPSSFPRIHCVVITCKIIKMCPCIFKKFVFLFPTLRSLNVPRCMFGWIIFLCYRLWGRRTLVCGRIYFFLLLQWLSFMLLKWHGYFIGFIEIDTFQQSNVYTARRQIRIK